MNKPATPNETLPVPLNNLWRLLWMLWMQPIFLNEKLNLVGVPFDISGWKAWHTRGIAWSYAKQLALTGIISLTLSLIILLSLVNSTNISINWIRLTEGIAISSVFFIIIWTLGINYSFNLSAIFPTFIIINSIELSGFLKSTSHDATILITSWLSIASIRKLSMQSNLVASTIAGLTYGFVMSTDYSINTGLFNGIFGVMIFSVILSRIPIALIELPTQITLFYFQKLSHNRITLRYSPVLHHDLCYLELLCLGRHIVATAPHDPELAERALRACQRSPGQQRHARWVIAQLEAQQLTNLAQENQFTAIKELQGRWLPQAEAAGPGTLLLRDIARQVLAADHASTPHHRLRYLNDAQALLDHLPNILTSETPERAEALAPVQAVFQRKLTERLTAAQAEAANLLPNPFLTQPLNPEDGAELFLGRDALIRQLEAILADPAQRNSIALLGPRRCGKSSLLRMLPLKLPDAVPIFFDLQDNPSGSPAQFYAAIASRVAEQARRERQMDKLPKLPPAADLAAFAAWLEQLDTALGGRRLLLCIDEFERLEQLFPDDRRGLLQFMGLLRATVQHRRNIRLLVAGVAPFDELSADLWSDHFINLRELRVEHLDEATAVQLLTRPIPELTAITPEVAHAVFQRTGGQPLLLQLYGSMLVDRLNAEQRTSTTADDLAAIDAQVLDGGNAANHFRNLYEVAPPEAKSVLLDMAHGQPTAPNPATRRYLLRRCLITREGAPGIPVFLDWVRAEC